MNFGNTKSERNDVLYRFINYNSPSEHDPTLEDRYITTVFINEKYYEIEILDSAGEEDYQNMYDMWIHFGEGFLLFFAINDLESFHYLNDKYERIIKGKKGIKPPIILVGTKQELDKERKVSYIEAKNFAVSLGIEYIEVSAKTNFNCYEVFIMLIKKIIETRNKKIKKDKHCILI